MTGFVVRWGYRGKAVLEALCRRVECKQILSDEGWGKGKLINSKIGEVGEI